MSDKKEAVRRRRARESIWELVAALPSPFGMHALSCYSELSAWSQQQQQGDTSHALLPGQYPEQSAAHAEGSPVVDWNSMPVSCEPCALLSNPANRGKKHGKNVLEQISMISFGRWGPIICLDCVHALSVPVSHFWGLFAFAFFGSDCLQIAHDFAETPSLCQYISWGACSNH